jgi:HK97 family phage major capsid protein
VQEHIQQRLTLNGGIRRFARSTNISTDAIELLLDKKAGDVGWVSETGGRDETATPELFKHKIAVHELYAKPRISQKLLDDAVINIESWLVEKVSHTMHQLENAAFVHGDGVGKPKGFMNYPLVAVGAGEWGKIESVKTGIDGGIADLDVLYFAIEAMKPELLDGAVWYVARSAVTQLRRLKTTDGMPIWQPSLTLKEPDLLLGYPVVVSDEMPALKSGVASTSMILANFRQGYQVVDRHDMRLLRDPYSSKPFVEFYATKRVGGDVIHFDAFKAIEFKE